MLIIDKLLISGIRWALDKVVDAVDAEMNNEDVLREELLAAQMRFELGEISEEDFAATQADLLGALREIQDRKRGAGGPRGALGGKGTKISSVDITFGGDEAEDESVLTGGEPQALVEVESGSAILDERPESQLAIEAAGVQAPVRSAARARKSKPKKKPKKRRG